MQTPLVHDKLKMTVPTGRIQEKVLRLLEQVGVRFLSNNRSYRPLCTDASIEAKLLKAQNIPSLVALGRHDCGFSGRDWIVEQEADVVELLDLGFDPVRIVAAVPEVIAASWGKNGPGSSSGSGQDPKRQLVVASEYHKLTERYIKEKGLNAVFLRAHGATEALPPEDADMIIDNTASGTTLQANRLVIVDEIMQSTTRFICNKEAWNNSDKRKRLEELTMLMRSTLVARGRVLLEMNVSKEDFERLVRELPCMRAPTVSELYAGDGYAVKVAVPSNAVPTLIPQLVSLGARDILEYKLEKIVMDEPAEVPAPKEERVKAAKTRS